MQLTIIDYHCLLRCTQDVRCIRKLLKSHGNEGIVDGLKRDFPTVADLKRKGRRMVALMMPLVDARSAGGLKSLSTVWPQLYQAVREMCGAGKLNAAERYDQLLSAFTDDAAGNKTWYEMHVLNGAPLPARDPSAPGPSRKKPRRQVLADSETESNGSSGDAADSSDNDDDLPPAAAKAPAPKKPCERYTDWFHDYSCFQTSLSLLLVTERWWFVVLLAYY